MRRLLEMLARLAPSLFVIAIGLVTFGHTLSHGFVYDDHWTIEENPAVTRPDGLGLVLRGSAESVGGEHAQHLEVDLRWRPLMVASNWIDWRLAGASPMFHHAHSLALYLICALLVRALARAFGSSKRVALASALVFVAHPLHVEVVSAVNYREDLLATALGLGAFLLLSPSRDEKPRSLALTIAGALCLSLAINAKATAAVVPVLLVLRDVLFARMPVKKRLPIYVLAVAALLPSRQILDLFTGHRPLGYAGAGHTAGFLHTCLAELAIWFEYARQMLVPTGLSPDYASIDELPYFHAKALAGGLLLVGLCVFSVKNARRPRLAFLATWFVVGLLPTAMFLAGPTPRADRHVFFSSVAGAILIAHAIEAGLRRLGQERRVSTVACAVVIGTCALVSAREAKKWHDDTSLWRAAASDPSSSVRAHVAWMGTEIEANRLERALGIGERAVKRWPENWQLHEQIGFAHQALGSPRLALAEYELAVRYGGGRDPNLLSKLGHAQFDVGDVARAIRTYEDAIQIAPTMARLHLNLGRVLAMSGRFDEAEARLRRAHALEPSEATLTLLRSLDRSARADPKEASRR